MKRLRSFAVAATLAVICLANVDVATEAHSVGVYHGNDFAFVYDFHSNIQACDQEADGHGVRAHWRSFNGNITVGSWDPNGAYGACGEDFLPPDAQEFRVCEAEVGCSAWEPK